VLAHEWADEAGRYAIRTGRPLHYLELHEAFASANSASSQATISLSNEFPQFFHSSIGDPHVHAPVA
jgi:hypothetical protein